MSDYLSPFQIPNSETLKESGNPAYDSTSLTLTVESRSIQALKAGDGDYNCEIEFRRTKDSWKAAYRMARLLKHAHRCRPAILDPWDAEVERVFIGNGFSTADLP